MAGCSAGGIGVYLALWQGWNPYLAFGGAFFLPLAPLYFYFSSDHVMRKRLQTLLAWRQEGLISAAEYVALRRMAIAWYGQRHYGEAFKE